MSGDQAGDDEDAGAESEGAEHTAAEPPPPAACPPPSPAFPPTTSRAAVHPRTRRPRRGRIEGHVQYTATAADRKVAPLVGPLPAQCQRDLDSLRAFIRRAIGDGKQAAAVPVTEMGRGPAHRGDRVRGRFVLRDLLRMEGNLVVHCLVRATGAEHGLQRLRAAMEEAEIWDEACAGRIRVVAGDVGEGASRPEPNRLRRLGAAHRRGLSLRCGCEPLHLLSRHPQDQRVQHAQRAGSVPAHPSQAPVPRLHHGGVPAVLLRLRQRVRRSRHRASGTARPRRDEAHVPALPRRLFVEQAGRRAERVVRAPGRAAGGVFRLPLTSRSTTGYTQPSDTSVRVYAAVAT